MRNRQATEISASIRQSGSHSRNSKKHERERNTRIPRKEQDFRCAGLLIPIIPVFVKTISHGFKADGSILHHIIGEFMQSGVGSFSASGIGKFYFYQQWRYGEIFKTLDPIYRAKSQLLPDDNRYYEQMKLLLSPVFDELGIKFDKGGYAYNEDKLDKAIIDAALGLTSIEQYVMAMDHQLALDFDVDFTKSLMPLLPVRSISCKGRAGARRRCRAGIGMRRAGCAGG